MTQELRNIAIIAHVDHGKTTLVDKLLECSDSLSARESLPERAMDSNDLERERGITILAKNTAIRWQDTVINIVDTPGHADFGGEVERILSMVDAVLLVVDAVEGPMPQTRFVTRKAFDHGLKPIVVINKMDRAEARPDWVMDATFDLMAGLGASDEQLDFPVIYASAIAGRSGHRSDDLRDGMEALFESVVAHCPPPDVESDGPLQLQVSALDYSSYVGAIGIGRIKRGALATNTRVEVIAPDGAVRKERVLQVFGFRGLDRVEISEAQAGDIVAFSGIEHPKISDTICAADHVAALPPLIVDDPTISMTFEVNTSPFVGREGRYVTSRQLADRLGRETIHNVALRVEPGESSEQFKVSGRGELHLAVLIETMRREGYEMAVSRPRVIYRTIDGVLQEPFENLTIDVEASHQGAVMEALGVRGADILDLQPDGAGRVRLDYRVPSRGLIGFQSLFRSITSGTGIMYHVFDSYRTASAKSQPKRANGVLLSNSTGKAVAFAIFNLQERGRMMLSPGDDIYEGQIVGIHSRDNDLVVNPMKTKQLSNIRAAGRDDAVLLTPPVRMTLEQAMEFIEDDELVEITPAAVRLRKRYLKEHERKQQSRRER